LKFFASSPITTIKAIALISLVCAGMYCTFSPASAADDVLERGKAAYLGLGACFSCHGATGKGDGPAAASLNPRPRSFVSGEFLIDTDGDGTKGSENDLLNVITNGTQKYNGGILMVGRPDIPEEDRKALVKYVLSLRK
jgi:mono/diheme cytochrome c family protein